MAHKTFISYKFSESTDLRDRIIKAMGDDAQYYQGECSDSPDLTDHKTESIRNCLKEMIWGTSVTIVILSPNMLESKWIPWEIRYSLRAETRNGVQSKQNGVVAVVKKVGGGYGWFENKYYSPNFRNGIVNYNLSKVPKIIQKNIFNSSPAKHPCDDCCAYDKFSQCAKCDVYDSMWGSYITIVEEDEFLANINNYIENAYDKSKELEKFDTHVQVEEDNLRKVSGLF